jgi:hypothetical protein
MTLHTLPFENRWSDGEHAWQWHVHLEQIGLENVRLWFLMEAARHEDGALVPFEVPPGFVRDWLAYHDRANERRLARWRTATAVLVAIAAIAASVSAWLLVMLPK